MRVKKVEDAVAWLRVRHKVTYYVMTFIFKQTNVESPIYTYTAPLYLYYYLLLTTYYYLTTTYRWRCDLIALLSLLPLLPSATFLPPPCVTITC